MFLIRLHGPFSVLWREGRCSLGRTVAEDADPGLEQVLHVKRLPTLLSTSMSVAVQAVTDGSVS